MSKKLIIFLMLLIPVLTGIAVFVTPELSQKVGITPPETVY